MRARRLAACLLAAAALGIGAVGCGGDDNETAGPATDAPTTAAPTTTAAPAPSGGGDATAGKEVFTASCSGCHTLSDAGASGAVGPNLDDLKPDEETVKNQVTNGGGSMPAFADKLSEQQIADVAAYVSSVAGG